MKLRTAVCLLFVFLPLLIWGQDTADLLVVNRIKAEAFQNSKVMDHMFYLTEVYGPHISNTPAYNAAGDWVVKRLEEYGLAAVQKEKWGPFGRGWSCTRFAAHLIEPQYAPLIGFPLAWTASTNGPIKGEPVLASMRSEADFEKFKGQLKGRIVLADPARALTLHTTAESRRYTDAELADLAMAPEPGGSPFAFAPRSPRPGQAGTFRSKLDQFLRDEGVLAILTLGQRGDGGTVFAAGSGSREVKGPVPPPTIALTPEHYNRIVRLLDKKIPVRVELEVEARFHQDGLDAFNVVGDIPGDRKKDELVMLGAHLDTWHGGTGATDDAAGCAVMMEAARILKTLGLKMDRTIRIALWSAEEQGLLGSRAYVKEHFADRETMALKPEHARLSAYYNLDNGAGKIRGIYLQSNDMIRPIFAAWLAPFKDLGVSAISIRNTRGTDHLSFDAVGLPGFQFIQDPLEYMSRAHHSNMDVYDRVQPGDLMQASAVIASLAYHTAIREQMLPRKPLPKPSPSGTAGGGRSGPP